MIRCYTLEVITGDSGAGTATTAYPLSGEILSVRMDVAGTIIADGTADFTLTRLNDGGTVLAVTNQTAPFQFQPREASHSTSGGTSAYATGVGPVLTDGVPIDDYLKCVVAQGAGAGTADLFIYYQR